MKHRSLLLALVATFATPALPAAAQIVGPGYQQWQPAWDRYQYDRRHVILGTVTNFQPFRLQLARPDGDVQTIDLKHGTVIVPLGETPATNQRVAVIGYYSNGTFIANRVILRD